MSSNMEFIQVQYYIISNNLCLSIPVQPLTLNLQVLPNTHANHTETKIEYHHST